MGTRAEACAVVVVVVVVVIVVIVVIVLIAVIFKASVYINRPCHYWYCH